jgi:hypothetical protein
LSREKYQWEVVLKSYRISWMKPSVTWQSAPCGPMALRPTLASSLPLSDFNEPVCDTCLVSILKDCTKDYYEMAHTRSVKVFSLFLLQLRFCSRGNTSSLIDVIICRIVSSDQLS